MLIPNGGWRFKIPQLGKDITAASYAELLNKATSELETAGVAVPRDYQQEFDDELCRQIPGIYCEVVAPVTNATRTTTAGDVIRFLRVLREWAGVGGELAPQEEAERRAEICAGCEFNVDIQGCSVCKGVSGMITSLIGVRETRFDRQLKGCAVCGCSNAAQIHFPLHVLQKGITPQMVWSPQCWKRPVSLSAG